MKAARSAGHCTIVINYAGRERDCVCRSYRPDKPTSRSRCAYGHHFAMHEPRLERLTIEGAQS